jgi:hypothetical protein
MSVECDYCSRIFSSEEAYLEHLFYDHDPEEVSEEDKQRVIERFDEEDASDTSEKNKDSEKSQDDKPEEPELESGSGSDESESKEKSRFSLPNVTFSTPVTFFKQNKLLVILLVVVGFVAIFGGLYSLGLLPNFNDPPTPTNNTTTYPAGYENLSEVSIKPVDVGEASGTGTIAMIVDGEKVDFTQQKYQTQNESFHFDDKKGGVWHKNGRRISLEYALHTVGIETNSTAIYYNGTLYQEDIDTNIDYAVNGVEVESQSVLLNDGDSIQIVVETQ